VLTVLNCLPEDSANRGAAEVILGIELGGKARAFANSTLLVRDDNEPLGVLDRENVGADDDDPANIRESLSSKNESLKFALDPFMISSLDDDFSSRLDSYERSGKDEVSVDDKRSSSKLLATILGLCDFLL
jgi:hypothetical protein